MCGFPCDPSPIRRARTRKIGDYIRISCSTENDIEFISSENWRGLEDSLETLRLRRNGIIALQPNSFATLKDLQVLDLSGNALFEVDGNVFKDGPFRLEKLNLANNMLSDIPYQQLSQLKLVLFARLVCFPADTHIIDRVKGGRAFSLSRQFVSLPVIRMRSYFQIVATSRLIVQPNIQNARILDEPRRHKGTFFEFRYTSARLQPNSIFTGWFF